MAKSTDNLILNDSIITPSTSNISSVTSTEENFDQKWSFEFSVILACIISVSAFCTIVGNGMVLMVIIRHRGMRTRTNLFLLNLAITDLLVGLLVEPFSITTLIQNDWVFGTAMCMLNGWMNGFCLITSIHTLMYISIHKYFSIVRPLSNPLKLNYIIAMMVSAWLWAAVCSTLNLVVLKVEYKSGTSQCGPRYPSTPITFIVHGLLQFTVMYIPAAILVFCYVRMFMEIKKHSQRLRTNSTVEEDFILSQQKKVAVTLFIVLATFVMMALPYHLYATYTTIEADKEHFPSFINPLAYMFLYLSSMCNPIIYAFRSPAFREGYKEILCQTPNYVISDESEQVPITRRLSSLIASLHRTSSVRSGNRNFNQCADNRTLTSKSTEAGEKREKPKFNRQKSLLELLRSTRQSTAQSVVHRNGDIIIMKGGKIVSVRRGGEGSPFLDRLKTLQETNDHGRGLAAGLAGPGRVMFGLVCQEIAEEGNNISLNGSNDLLDNSNRALHQTELNKCEDHTYEGAANFTESVIVNSHLEQDQCPHGEKNWNKKSANSNALKYSLSANAENGNISEHSECPATGINFPSDNTKKLTVLKTVAKGLSNTSLSEDIKSGFKNRSNFPLLLKSSTDESTTDSAISSFDSGGVVIHVGDDDDILSVMPLTPNTREYLAKSDMNISQADPDHAQNHGEAIVLKALQLSQSSEHILKKPPVIQRYPSLEFLDPPVHLFRSHSNISVHSSTQRHRGRSKLLRKRERSQSPDVGSSSKSYLKSIFSSRNNVTHV